jgi:glucose-1-phosphate thymidylyltransferase
MTRLHLVVLAAGFGTRLYPLTERTSKPLLEVGGEPLLTRLVHQLTATGAVHAVTVVTNHKFHADYLAWRAALRAPVPVALVDDGAGRDADARGALADLRLALAAATDPGEGWIVAGGDNVFDCPFEPLVAAFTASGGPLLVVRDVPLPPEPGRYSEVTLDAKGLVRSFREKPPDPRSPLSAVCLYFLPPELAGWLDDYFAAGGEQDAPGHFFAWLVPRTAVHGVRLPGRWFDIGTPQALAAARAWLG